MTEKMHLIQITAVLAWKVAQVRRDQRRGLSEGGRGDAKPGGASLGGASSRAHLGQRMLPPEDVALRLSGRNSHPAVEPGLKSVS